jgi:NTE family protein
MSGNTRALVLSGGGTAGGAWMLGIIHALREEGVDLGDADLIVGTSAGARTGAALAAGGLDQAVAMYQRSQVPPLEVPVALEEFMAAVLRVMAETPGRQEAVRRIANFAPLGSSLVPEDDRRRMVAAHLPADAWPDKRLAVVAVDAETGLRAVFDATSGAGLLEAVLASGALPGVFPLVTINGTRYADGGVHSPYNADLAAGHDVVVVLSPVAPDPNLQALLDAEVAALAPATVYIIAADSASLTAIGANPLASQTAAAALAAGALQAGREQQNLKTMWNTRPGQHP